MKELTGKLQASGMRIAIVISRFNELITRSLLIGALDGLSRHGVDPKDIDIAWVPGAFEIPLISQQMASSGKYDAILCLGAVIRGATPHFDYVCAQAASGIARISQEYSLPVIFDVLTTNTIEEALERAGTKAGNKGFEGAVCAIEMVDLMRQLKQEAHHLNKHVCKATTLS
jgi:6,7-dimethyl-8-ribityllumazine synthase